MSVHNRWLRVALVLSLLLPGMALGIWLGARFLVPAGSGLAGAPIALGYGLLAAVVLALVATPVSARLPRRWLVALTRAAGDAGLLVSLCLAAFEARACRCAQQPFANDDRCADAEPLTSNQTREADTQ